MIPPERVRNALRALNRVLVLARKMAYDRVAHKEMAEVLDIAEYLPRLLAEDEDRTPAFRQCLEDLAARWPDFNSALQYFDDPSLRWPW